MLTLFFLSITKSVYASVTLLELFDSVPPVPIIIPQVPTIIPQVPIIISNESEASDLIKGLRLAKLIALHPSAAVEFSFDLNNQMLVLGTPQTPSTTREDSLYEQISDEDIKNLQNNDLRKRQIELLSSCIGHTTIDLKSIKSLCPLFTNLPSSDEGPLTLSILIMLLLYQSNNPHVSHAASHALRVVMQHESQRRRTALSQMHSTKGKHRPYLDPIPLDQLIHSSILSSHLTEVINSFALPHCRAPVDFQVRNF